MYACIYICLSLYTCLREPWCFMSKCEAATVSPCTKTVSERSANHMQSLNGTLVTRLWHAMVSHMRRSTKTWPAPRRRHASSSQNSVSQNSCEHACQSSVRLPGFTRGSNSGSMIGIVYSRDSNSGKEERSHAPSARYSCSKRTLDTNMAAQLALHRRSSAQLYARSVSQVVVERRCAGERFKC